MSTLTTDAEGFVTISQGRSQNDQGNIIENEQSLNAQARMPKPVVTFYQGEPEVLGTVQIFVGILLITFGVMFTILCNIKCNFMESVIYTRVLIWSGVLYIVSGSLSVAASVKPTVVKWFTLIYTLLAECTWDGFSAENPQINKQVKSSLVMNIISIAAACFEIIMITTVFPSPIYYRVSDQYCAYYKPNNECIGAFNPRVCLAGIMVFLCMLSVLMFCVTISTSVFGCRTVCRSSYHEMRVIIYQSASLSAPDTTIDASPPTTSALDS